MTRNSDYIENLEKRCEELQTKVTAQDTLLDNYERTFKLIVAYTTDNHNQVTSMEVKSYTYPNMYGVIDCCSIAWSKKGWKYLAGGSSNEVAIDLKRGQPPQYYADELLKTLMMEFLPYQLMHVGGSKKECQSIIKI
jgi:hypothetical protein